MRLTLNLNFGAVARRDASGSAAQRSAAQIAESATNGMLLVVAASMSYWTGMRRSICKSSRGGDDFTEKVFGVQCGH